ncbi:MAG: biopolymer transporter ExbD [Planctomycetia bacterium]|nr:biopolymer transporter ExbD [Planctomycetia bacterium]
MRSPRNLNDSSHMELNLTSMIDVVFLLLIFFALTANFNEPEKILPTNLAMSGAISSEQTQRQEQRTRVITRIATTRERQTTYLVDSKRAESLEELEALFNALREIDSETCVVIAPERDVPLEAVLDVYDCARRVGLASVKFAAFKDSLVR